ncbi:F-box/WD repeat-containing protein 4 [Hibiscus syriacus]|uniref:F-box/WD repeat-containing protein 4 n=1 Tax=Hibiscus syriacus TaxID=106335 RepID=A0A6A3A1P0_HIBSY|nr:F-box/WD repeat-containing protein 4 [Hibiscus syriacus]
MAMAARFRSTSSLFHRLLRSDLLSSHAPRSTLHQTLLCPEVPLALFGGSGNYASALYLASVKGNALDKVESELLDLVQASKKSQLFSIHQGSLLVFFMAFHQEFVLCMLACATAALVFLILAENGRLRHIESIAKRFVELTMAHRGEVKAIVTSVIPDVGDIKCLPASIRLHPSVKGMKLEVVLFSFDASFLYQPLPPQEEKELKETLQEIIGQGKQVKLEQKINPSILGGLVVEFGQKVFDMSIKTRAQQMERFLREPINFGSI